MKKNQLFLLLIWFAIALILRLTNLSSKPIWSDEFATLVFSLGQSFRSIPFNQVIDIETLLAPLKLNNNLGLELVSQNLFTESNHPPVYFMLTHIWVKLFSQNGELISIWGARSLSALFGALAVPAMFLLGWVTFRSYLVGQIAAALMAVSPFSIYLSQEARHYTLPTLLVILSLIFFIIALRQIQNNQSISLGVILGWIAVNSLGIAVHFFFILTLAAEGLVILGIGLYYVFSNSSQFYLKFLPNKSWMGIYLSIIGTAIGGLVWVPLLLEMSNSKHQLVDWTFHGNPQEQFLEPISQIVVWITTFLVIFPLENQGLLITVISGIGMMLILGFTLKIIIDTWKKQPQFWQTSANIFLGFIASAILIILIITYTLGINLTLVARYQFIYFPAILCLIAVFFAIAWEKNNQKNWILLIGIASLISGIMVVNHLAYQKPDRADIVAEVIAETLTPHQPTLIATVYKSHEQTGEMMSLAWEFKRLGIPQNLPQFLLATKAENYQQPMRTLNQVLAQFSRPLNLWMINFSAPFEPEKNNCTLDPNLKLRTSGYYFRMYHCFT